MLESVRIWLHYPLKLHMCQGDLARVIASMLQKERLGATTQLFTIGHGLVRSCKEREATPGSSIVERATAGTASVAAACWRSRHIVRSPHVQVLKGRSSSASSLNVIHLEPQGRQAMLMDMKPTFVGLSHVPCPQDPWFESKSSAPLPPDNLARIEA